jgi:hypothetical protein
MNAQFLPQDLRSGSRPRTNQPRHSFFRRLQPWLGRTQVKLDDFLAGPRAVIEARYSPAQAWILILATLPSILGVLAMKIPSVLFPTEGHRAFFLYAHTVATDPLSLVPVVLGIVTLLLSFRIPVHSH